MIGVIGADAADELARVHAASFDKAWSARDISRMLANPAAIALAASNSNIVGFVLAWAAAGDGEILTIAVTPSHRRRGLAASLLKALAPAAAERGAVALHLDVAETNIAARALYGKLGYRQVGRRCGYYATPGGPVDALVLRLDLDPAPA